NRLTHCVIDVRDVGRMSYLPWILRWFIVFQLALGLPAFGSAIASQTTTHLFGGLCRTWPAATYYNGFYGRNGNGTVLPEAASPQGLPQADAVRLSLSQANRAKRSRARETRRRGRYLTQSPRRNGFPLTL